MVETSVGAELLSKILASPRLPTLPVVALEVLELAEQPDVNIEQLARTLGHDPALASKVLRTANSSLYAQPRAVSTLPQAIMLLGLNSVRSLALGFSLVDTLRREHGASFDYEGFWRHSLNTAVAARVIAAKAREVDPQEAFLGGLLHRLGMLAMAQVLGDRYAAALAPSSLSPDVSDAEQTLLGLTHPIVGEALCQQWGLPPKLASCLRYYDEPDGAPAASRPLVRTVAAAADVADLLLSRGDPALALARYRERCAPWFGLTDDACDALLHAVQEECVAASRILELAPQPELDVSAILERANERLLDLSLRASADVARAERQNRDLAADATTDALTGIANRRRFDRFLEGEVLTALTDGTLFSLLFLDLDHFKRLNDTHGHLAGDRMLSQVAAALRSEVRADDVLARYGGEEFAVVMPNVDAATATRAAERLRRAVERLVVRAPDGSSVSTTASIGMATFDWARHERAEDVLADADAALYEAKRAGRNRTHAFTPKAAAA